MRRISPIFGRTSYKFSPYFLFLLLSFQTRQYIEKENASVLSFSQWFYVYLFFAHFEIPSQKTRMKTIRLLLLESIARYTDPVKQLKDIQQLKLPGFSIGCVDINSFVSNLPPVDDKIQNLLLRFVFLLFQLFWIQGRIMEISMSYRNQTDIVAALDNISYICVGWAEFASCYTRRSLNKVYRTQASDDMSLIKHVLALESEFEV